MFLVHARMTASLPNGQLFQSLGAHPYTVLVSIMIPLQDYHDVSPVPVAFRNFTLALWTTQE